MNISSDTQNVIKALEYISGNSLRKPKDLSLIIELCATYDGASHLNNLIFTGKSVWNLQSKLKKITSSDEGAILIQQELYKGIERMKEIITEVIRNADDDSNKRFEDVYLADTKGTLKNLIDLSFDLSMFKELQNQLKKK